MSDTSEILEIGPREEAERLWRGAREAHGQAGMHLVHLCESLDFGIRAAEILATLALAPVRDKFPATIAMMLESPDPDVDLERDALATPHALGFLHILDMLSADGLDCIARKLHRGWEDRRRSCARSRQLARETLGIELDGPTRERLLRLEAYRNRIFRIPPPIRIRPTEIVEAFPDLERLVEALAAS